MIALKKKTQATKCSDHRTVNLIAHTAKKIAMILRRRIERKIEDVLGEDQFGFRRVKGTRDAIGMMRIIAERTLEIDGLCPGFIDWQKAFGSVNWIKSMQILKRTGIDWRERRLIRIAMAKAAFNKKKNLFTSTLNLNLRKKLVKCYIWSMALYGAVIWTLRAADQKYLESFEMW